MILWRMDSDAKRGFQAYYPPSSLQWNYVFIYPEKRENKKAKQILVGVSKLIHKRRPGLRASPNSTRERQSTLRKEDLRFGNEFANHGGRIREVSQLTPNNPQIKFIYVQMGPRWDEELGWWTKSSIRGAPSSRVSEGLRLTYRKRRKSVLTAASFARKCSGNWQFY